MSSTGLGKGLGALIRESAPPDSGKDTHILPLKDLMPNPNQPRRKFAEQAIAELALSIRSQGLLQPILVRPMAGQEGKYEIVAGERRWRASKLAGLLEVPVVVKKLSDQETLAAALIENLQREDLNPLEEAVGIQTLKEEFNLSQEDLATQLGKSRSAIANCLRILSLPKHMLSDLADGKLSSGHARALLSITDGQAQEYLRNLILEESLSVREAEGYAAQWKQSGSFQIQVENNTVDVQPEDHLVHTDNSIATSNPEYISDTSINGSESTVEHVQSTEQIDSKSKVTRPQSAIILGIQQRIGHALSVPVKVTGKETKGRISISYRSREELEALLAKLSGGLE